LPYWIKGNSFFSVGKSESLKKVKNWNVWESSVLELRNYFEVGAHQDTAATSCLAKSLLEYGVFKSWAWIFHRLLQGTWSKNSSNSLGIIRLYKALKNKGFKCKRAREEQGVHPVRIISDFDDFPSLWGGEINSHSTAREPKV
jgi:hypothetical protein